MTADRRFSLLSVLFVVGMASLTFWLASSKRTVEQREIERLRSEIIGLELRRASVAELNLFGDRLLLKLEGSSEDLGFVIEDYLRLLNSSSWLNETDRSKLTTGFTRRCLRTRALAESEMSPRLCSLTETLVSTLPHYQISGKQEWSEGRRDDLELMLEIWQRNRQLIDPAFDPLDSFNHGVASVPTPSNDIRYLDPSKVVPDIIDAAKSHRRYDQLVAENNQIVNKSTRQVCVRELSGNLKAAIIRFVTYAFEQPPNEIEQVEALFRNYGFDMPDQLEILSNLSKRSER